MAEQKPGQVAENVAFTYWVEDRTFDLIQRRGRSARLFVLLDCLVGVEPFFTSFSLSHVFPVAHMGFDAPPAILVEIDDDSGMLLSHSLELYRRARDASVRSSVAGWLVSQMEGGALAAKLARFIDGESNGSEDSRPFLFFSSQVAPHLPYLMDRDRYASFRRGIDAWAYLGRRGEMEWLPDSVMGASTRQTQRMLFKQRLSQINLINQTLDALADDEFQRGEVVGQAHVLLERLDRETMKRNDLDRSLLLAHALAIHPDFHRHPKVVKLLSSPVEGEYGLALAMNHFSGDDLERIRRSLNEQDGSKG